MRQAAIRGFLQEATRLFRSSEDFTQAYYLERQAQILENMTDEEFEKQYPSEEI
jgi:hypothetical protein